MGAKSSKNEPIIIYNEPDVSIQFSPNLLRKLESPPPDPVLARFSGLPTPPPSLGEQPHFRTAPVSAKGQDKAKPQQDPAQIDELVKERVRREMELHQQKRLVHEQRSADQVRREAEDLLRRQKIPPKTKIDEKCVAAQEAVTECYRRNPTRTLDCWREVEDLKERAKIAQRQFVESH